MNERVGIEIRGAEGEGRARERRARQGIKNKDDDIQSSILLDL